MSKTLQENIFCTQNHLKLPKAKHACMSTIDHESLMNLALVSFLEVPYNANNCLFAITWKLNCCMCCELMVQILEIAYDTFHKNIYSNAGFCFFIRPNSSCAWYAWICSLIAIMQRLLFADDLSRALYRIAAPHLFFAGAARTRSEFLAKFLSQVLDTASASAIHIYSDYPPQMGHLRRIYT
jgi:hypothetical protein